jgi:hypothetical protein
MPTDEDFKAYAREYDASIAYAHSLARNYHYLPLEKRDRPRFDKVGKAFANAADVSRQHHSLRCSHERTREMNRDGPSTPEEWKKVMEYERDRVAARRATEGWEYASVLAEAWGCKDESKPLEIEPWAVYQLPSARRRIQEGREVVSNLPGSYSTNTGRQRSLSTPNLQFPRGTMNGSGILVRSGRGSPVPSIDSSKARLGPLQRPTHRLHHSTSSFSSSSSSSGPATPSSSIAPTPPSSLSGPGRGSLLKPSRLHALASAPASVTEEGEQVQIRDFTHGQLVEESTVPAITTQ